MSLTYQCFLTGSYNNGLFFDGNISEQRTIGTEGNAANFERMSKRAVNMKRKCRQSALQETHSSRYSMAADTVKNTGKTSFGYYDIRSYVIIH